MLTAVPPINFPINQFFPEDKYKDTCNSNKALAPMYLIGLGQPLKLIKKNIQTNEAVGRQWNIQHPDWKVTPLHVAVWRQAVDVIQYLLTEKRCDPSVPDAIGFLPVHYAEAVENQEIAQMLRAAMKVNYISHKDLWEKLLIRPAILPETTVFAYMDVTGRAVEGNSAKFAELTGCAQFTPTIFFRNRQALLNVIAKTIEDAKQGFTVYKYGEEINEILATNPLPLCLTKQGEAGWGVCSMRELQPFVPVAIYGGEVVAKEEREKSSSQGNYFLDPVEAHRSRNIAGMINDGFPNCIFDYNRHPSGVAFSVIVPIRRIAKGEGLFIDYQAKHMIKKMRRSELNLDEARAFLKTKGILAMCKEELLPCIMEIKRGKGNSKRIHEMHALLSQVSYLLYTSSALIQLVFEKRIKLYELKTLASDNKYLPIFQNESLKQKTYLEWASSLEIFEKMAAATSWDILNEINRFFIRLYTSFSVQTANAALVFLGCEFNSNWKKPRPEQDMMILIKFFEAAIPAFEIMGACMYRKSDITDEELAILRRIENGHDGVEKIFLDVFSKADMENYPKLKAFIAERNHMRNQQRNPQANAHRLIGMIRATSEMNPETEYYLNALERDPLAQAMVAQLILSKK